MSFSDQARTAAPPTLVDPQSQASLPGQVTVQYPVWIRCFPGQTVPQILLLALLLAGAFALALETHSFASAWPCVLGILALGRRLELKFRLIREHFQHGCLNPGVVVSVSPCLVAVLTDMRQQPGETWPVVKIVAQPLGRTSGGRPQVGDRVATAALYSGSRQRPRWDDFRPIAVQCVTARREEIAHALARLEANPNDVWAELDRALAQVPTPTRPGLYWITTPQATPITHNPFLPPIS